MTTGDPRGAPTPRRPEPPDVPAELDLSGRRPRRRPPAQSEIRGINTIASLPAGPGDGRDQRSDDRRDDRREEHGGDRREDRREQRGGDRREDRTDGSGP